MRRFTTAGFSDRTWSGVGDRTRSGANRGTAQEMDVDGEDGSNDNV
jgi:hypothetical protein